MGLQFPFRFARSQGLIHKINFNILTEKITDQDTSWLLKEVIASFNKETRQLELDISICEKQIERESKMLCGRGIPIGNLTSQLFANIYLNELDLFIKHRLKIRCYIRYADDFVIFTQNKEHLKVLIPKIEKFLNNKLKLRIHPNKLFIRTVSSGLDFLGWINFPKHRVLRTVTKRRMYKRIVMSPKEPARQSYLGLIKHGATFKIKTKLENLYQEAKEE